MAVKNSKTGYPGLFPNLQIKTRVFVLTSNRTPIRHMIAVKHTGSKPLTYNDSGLNRALRWATNQISPFVVNFRTRNIENANDACACRLRVT